MSPRSVQELDHHYHRVDTEILWSTVDRDLEPLREAVRRRLSAKR